VSKLIPEIERTVLKRLLSNLHDSIRITVVVPMKYEMYDLWIGFVSELKQIDEMLNVNLIITNDNTIPLNLNISMVPVLIINGKNTEVRFYDVPIGLELIMFIDALYAIINEEGDEDFKHVEKKHTIKLFVSPTCSRCIPVGRIVFGFALLNKCCTVEIIDVLEHATLLEHYGILTVPVIIVDNNSILYKELTEENIISFLAKNLVET
jgi:thioredoxin reductase (NADPH)